MHRTDFSHWVALCEQLALPTKAKPWHGDLIAAYSEKHRHYHTLQHIEECLTIFDDMRSQAQRPAFVEMALWYHDAVYDPHSPVNEESSEALMSEHLGAAGASLQTIKTVRELIMVTKTHRASAVLDGALLVDIDLAILGQPASRFWDYERGIKAEYAWVPDRDYNQGRTEILKGFLDRATIYQTDNFQRRYEAVARANLKQSIERLQSGS